MALAIWVVRLDSRVVAQRGDIDVADRVGAFVLESAHDVIVSVPTALCPLPGLLPNPPPIPKGKLPSDSPAKRVVPLVAESADRRLVNGLPGLAHPRADLAQLAKLSGRASVLPIAVG